MIINRVKKTFPFWHYEQRTTDRIGNFVKFYIPFDRFDNFWFFLKSLNVRVYNDNDNVVPVYIKFSDTSESRELDITGNKFENENLGTPIDLINQNPISTKSLIVNEFVNFESNIPGIPSNRKRLFPNSGVYGMEIILDVRNMSNEEFTTIEFSAYGKYIPNGEPFQECL